MISANILKYYKWLSLATLIASIAGAITLYDGTIIEKFGIGLLINLLFHLPFHLLNRLLFGLYDSIETDNRQIKIFVRKALKIFSLAVMAFSLIGFIGLLNSVFNNHHYDHLILTIAFVGIFLGGYSSNLNLSEY
jgi:hypothetical protein